MIKLASTGEEARGAVAQMTDEEVVHLVNQALVPASDEKKYKIWELLFYFMGGVAIILSAGAIFLLGTGKETAAAVVLVPVSAIIAGLLGLFSDNPTKNP